MPRDSSIACLLLLNRKFLNLDEDSAMQSVVGTWRLVRAVSRDGDGNELPLPYGGHGTGRVMLGADGRMMAVTCDGRREIPGGARRELFCEKIAPV